MSDDKWLDILLSLAIFVFSILIGTIFNSIALTIHGLVLDSGIKIDVVPPDIQNTVIIDSLIDLVLSPSDLLQGIKGLLEINNAITNERTFALLSVFIGLLSLFNVFFSWKYKTRWVSVALSLSLIVVYSRPMMLLVEYLLSVILSFLSSIVY